MWTVQGDSDNCIGNIYSGLHTIKDMVGAWISIMFRAGFVTVSDLTDVGT